uniref:Peptidase M1 membrane alanine aminopeptidase domain-containing protein n=1 Tax=mine drainage metagenome TaxID=410659 RepID=E6Q041_9ZZZZ
MKVVWRRAVRRSCRWLALACVLSPAALPAQTTTSAPTPSSQNNVETEQNQAKKGKVIFSRSINDDGQVVNGGGGATEAGAGSTGTPAAKASAAGAALPPAITTTDAERSSVVYTDFDMDVRLRPSQHYLAARALFTVRNDGKAPLRHLPLQLSSTLAWEQIRVERRDAAFTQAVLNSDTDHTGQLNEATVTLPEPLAVGASVQVDVRYSGTVEQSARRLLAIGTPGDVANASDWDRISGGFTGLRGFGNVVWYPVTAKPVILGDGARVFDEIGQHKLELSGAHLRLALTVETTASEVGAGLTPNIAIVDGQPVSLATTQSSDPALPSIAVGHVENATLGFETISLFVASRTAHTLPNTTLWALPESEGNVAEWSEAAGAVMPFLRSWLGQTPRSQLTILELPESNDIPFETGAMLATPVRAATPEVLNNVMAHALTHAWVLSRRAWLSEGVAHFMGTMWMEKQQGRDQALAMLANARSALALAEPSSPGESDGQPLLTAISPVYYRTKAAYVFWMLRELVTDETLSAAFRAYDPKADTTPDYFEHLIEQAGDRHNLQWFFNDWVYRDRGLPDLAIDSVYSTPTAMAGSYLVSVNLSNNGYAGAEVPVQVISEVATMTQRIVLAGRSKGTIRILLQGTPTEVRANDGTIPETDASIHSKLIGQPGTAQAPATK